MRYFLLGLILLSVAIVSLAGFRGDRSRRPPIEIFPDMDRQPKLRPQTENNFFPNRITSQLPVSGTIARGSAYEENPVNTGRITGTTNFIETNPLPITEALLKRGQERFAISCQPCHGAGGDGKGITTKYGMAVIADLHDAQTRKVVQQPDGEIFNTITSGKGVMGAYGPNIAVNDRWAIIAYLRALQRSRLATVDDVPKELQANFKK